MSKNITNKYAFGKSSQVESLMLPMPHVVLEAIGGGILQNDNLQNIGEDLFPDQSFKAKKQHDVDGKETHCVSYQNICHNAFFIFRESKSLFIHLFNFLGPPLTSFHSGNVLPEEPVPFSYIRVVQNLRIENERGSHLFCA